MTFVTTIGPAVIDTFPWLERFYDDDLATGNNDGTSEVNAWQSAADMVAGAVPGMRVNMKRAASPVTLAADLILPTGIQEQPIWYRGYGSTVSDRTKWQADTTASFNVQAGSSDQLILSDVDITGANTTATFAGPAVPSQLFLRCAFANTGVGPCVWVGSMLIISCSFTNTGTFTANNANATRGNGSYIGCTLQSEGPNINAEMNIDSRHLLMFGCTFISDLDETAGTENLRIAISHAEASYLAVLENSIFSGDRGIHLASLVGTHEGAQIIANNVIGDTTHAIEHSSTSNEETVCVVNNAISNSTTADYTGWNNWEDLIIKFPLTADPFTSSAGGDLSLNNTAGGGADCRDGVVIGLLNNGGASETYDSIADFGGVRHGSADGGPTDTLAGGSSSGGGGGIKPWYAGILPITKTSELSQ